MISPSKFDQNGLSVLATRMGNLKRRYRAINLLSLGIIVVIASGVYSFGIGRPRFQSTSQFIIRQPGSSSITTPLPLQGGSFFSSSSVLSSLEDGRYLQVHLNSPEVLERSFRWLLESGRYSKKMPDIFAGISEQANSDEKLIFYRNQVQLTPHDLSGVIELKTTALNPSTALQLNKILLNEAQRFVNEMNHSISREQLGFARREVVRSQARLNQATEKLNALKLSSGQLNPIQESEATSKVISNLEAQLIELKVEGASLKRQYRYNNPANVQIVTNKIEELEKQLKKERAESVSPNSKDLSGKATETMILQNQVDLASESLRAAMIAMENSRAESQRQLKFLVILSDPRIPETQDWSWRWKFFLGSIGILLTGWAVSGFMLGIRKRL